MLSVVSSNIAGKGLALRRRQTPAAEPAKTSIHIGRHEYIDIDIARDLDVDWAT